MSRGTVREIWIAPEMGAQMEHRESVRARAGQGLEGDRYCGRGGSSAPDQHVTLIEAEQLEWFQQTTGIRFPAAWTRRNLITRGISLNPLVGHHFRIGDVEIKGIRLCEPCGTLQRRTGLPILPAMVGRAGLNGQILSDGEISVGATLEITKRQTD